MTLFERTIQQLDTGMFSKMNNHLIETFENEFIVDAKLAFLL